MKRVNFLHGEAFTQALLTRFGSAYVDPMEFLVKLRHSTNVVDYMAQFESLSNRQNYTCCMAMNCFLRNRVMTL